MGFKTRLSKELFIVVCFIIMLILTGFSINRFIRNIEQNEIDFADYNIEDTARRSASAIRQIFNGYVNTLNVAAIALQKCGNFKSPEALSMLNEISKLEGFEGLAIETLDGKSYTSDGYVFDKNHLAFLEDIIKGNTSFSDVTDALFDDEPIVNIYAPIINELGETTAFLRCALKTSKLADTYHLNTNEIGYFAIIDGNGRYVAISPSMKHILIKGNHFEDLYKMEHLPDFSADKTINALKNGREVHSKFRFEGMDVYAYYAPTRINKWHMMLAFPIESVYHQSKENVMQTMYLIAEILLILFTLLAYIFISIRNEKKKSELDGKCFRILTSQTNKAVLEWNYSQSSTHTYYTFNEVLNKDKIVKKHGNDELDSKMIHPDDLHNYRTTMDSLIKGDEFESIKFRLKDERGEYHWCSIYGTVIRDDKKRPYKALCFLENIDEQVKKEESLLRKTQLDALTGLYNKEAISILAEEIIENSTDDNIHALICFDIDNFKSINDSFGHLFGDEVLKTISAKIKNLFRSSDCLGRFGGDEFALFLKDIPSLEFINEKVDVLNKTIKHVYMISDTERSVSASIGIALYPKDGKSYEELFKNADIASYKAKNSGKDRYEFYQ
ncbi:MAG: diguanylate cyclase [Synergistaceae bacterium]|nr:diguanylate cyclase [Synergistaceae bacterium]